MNSWLRVIGFMVIIFGILLMLSGCSVIEAATYGDSDRYFIAIRDVQNLCDKDQRFMINKTMYLCFKADGGEW